VRVCVWCVRCVQATSVGGGGMVAVIISRGVVARGVPQRARVAGPPARTAFSIRAKPEIEVVTGVGRRSATRECVADRGRQQPPPTKQPTTSTNGKARQAGGARCQEMPYGSGRPPVQRCRQQWRRPASARGSAFAHAPGKPNRAVRGRRVVVHNRIKVKLKSSIQ